MCKIINIRRIIVADRFLMFMVALLCLSLRAEADSTRINLAFPVYSQYLQNGLVINPAYSGARGALSGFVSYRTQWSGISGTPNLQTVSLHTPFKNERDAIGILAQFMQYGFTKNTSLHGNYAHSMKFARGKLHLGMKAGVDILNNNFSDIKTVKPDEVFTSSEDPYVFPNFGAGAYYYSERIFIGLSVPRFLSYRKLSSNSTQAYHSFNDYDFILTGGGLIDINNIIKFKPSFLCQYSFNKAEQIKQVDISGNFIFADIVWAGASWRVNEKAIVGFAQMQVNQQFMIGLSYDCSLRFMNTIKNGSVEFCLKYEFGSKVSAANPRYF